MPSVWKQWRGSPGVLPAQAPQAHFLTSFIASLLGGPSSLRPSNAKKTEVRVLWWLGLALKLSAVERVAFQTNCFCVDLIALSS